MRFPIRDWSVSDNIVEPLRPIGCSTVSCISEECALQDVALMMSDLLWPRHSAGRSLCGEYRLRSGVPLLDCVEDLESVQDAATAGRGHDADGPAAP